mgnify:CR=1 FL=1
MSITLRRLLKLVAPYLPRMIASVLLGFLTIASGIGLMSVAAYIIARAALQPPLAELRVAIAGVRAFGIARGLLRYAERLLSHETALRILTRLRVWIYENIEPLAPASLETYRSGDLLARLISDVNTLENLFVRALAPTGVSIIVGLAMTFFMGLFHPAVALVYLLFYALAALLIPWLSTRWTNQIGDELVALRSEMFSTILDGLQGSADLLAFNQVDEHMRNMNRTTENYHRLQHRSAWKSGFSDGLSLSIANLSAIALLTTAIPLIQSGSITGIELAVLILANLASYEAAFALSPAYQELNRDLAAGERIFDLFENKAEFQPGLLNPIERVDRPPRIEFRDVTYIYPGRTQPALHNLTMVIPPGESVAIVGPSGGGKTTLSDILLQFRQGYGGEILIDGHELRTLPADSLRRIFSVIPQQPFLFHSTLKENLSLANPGASEAELLDAVERAQLSRFIERLPDGMHTLVGEHGYQLSAGERQRVSIARAILKNAPALILDEAMANLDADTEARIWRSIAPMISERTSLIISHRLNVLEGCAQILVLDQGFTIERGTYAALIEGQGWFARAARSERVGEAMETLQANY